MPLSPKSRLGTYEILGPLGAGGMGEVYRAKDLRLGREVAVKVLPDAVASSPDRQARFEREARTVAGLNHPNIVTLYSVETGAGSYAQATALRFIALGYPMFCYCDSSLEAHARRSVDVTLSGVGALLTLAVVLASTPRAARCGDASLGGLAPATPDEVPSELG